MSTEQYKFLLNETDLPKQWYNISADMPVAPTPVLNPHTKEPITPEFLNVLFPMSLIEQEMSTDRYIDIPEEVREIYKLWRPTPLIRARRACLIPVPAPGPRPRCTRPKPPSRVPERSWMRARSRPHN